MASTARIAVGRSPTAAIFLAIMRTSEKLGPFYPDQYVMFLAGVLTGTKDYMNNISIATIVVAVIGAVIAVVGYGMVTGRSRTGRGPI